MKAQLDALKKMKSKGPEPKKIEEQEKKSGMGDKAPDIGGVDVTQPVHGQQTHGELAHPHEALAGPLGGSDVLSHPDVLAAIQKLIEQHSHPGREAQGLDEKSRVAMHSVLKSLK